MTTIKLNKDEFNYLCQMNIFSKKNRTIFDSKKIEKDMVIIELSENQADEIRDKCGEKLQIVGFDEKYDLTQEGKILESLIDKFYIG